MLEPFTSQTAPSVKRLLCKGEDLNLEPQQPPEKGSSAICNPSAGGGRGGSRLDLLASHPSCIGELEVP